MAERDVIREYLVSLGFSIDQRGARRFADALGVTNKRALAVTAGIVGVAVAAEEMVRSFAKSMTNLYYASQRTKTPVAQLQAFKFAAEQVGISGEDALATIEALSAELRKNPGKQALLQTLGITTKGISNLEQMHSLVQGLNQKFPYFVAQQFAEQFGIPEHVFFQLTNNYSELIAKEKEHQALLKSLGIDSDAAAAAARRYDQDLKELGLRFDLLKQKASAPLLPIFKDAVQGLTRGVDSILELGEKARKTTTPGPSGAMDRARLLRDHFAPGATLPAFKEWWRSIPDWMRGVRGRLAGNSEDPDWPVTPAMIDANERRVRDPDWPVTAEIIDANDRRTRGAPTAADIRGAAARIAEEFGIPKSIFASMIDTESRWNPRAISNKGAMGLTQLMPGTAKDVGVTDPFDPMQNLRGGAAYLKQQFEKFGDWRKALAAYNYGPNRDFSPAYATYADPILRAAAATETGEGRSVVLHQKTDIHVTGGGDPLATGRAVAGEQERVNADLTRIFATVPR